MSTTDLHSANTAPTSPSPERGLTSLLSRSRSIRSGKKSAASSSTSLASYEPPGPSGLRSSIDRGIDKLRRNSNDAERRPTSRESGARKLSKLVPTRSRRRNTKKDSLPSPDERGRPGSQGLAADAFEHKLRLTPSADSLDSDGRSGGSSLLTEDSDPESSGRPTLASRQSHREYLTLSSPLIATHTVDTNTTAESTPVDSLSDLSGFSSFNHLAHTLSEPNRLSVVVESPSIYTLSDHSSPVATRPATPPRSDTAPAQTFTSVGKLTSSPESIRIVAPTKRTVLAGRGPATPRTPASLVSSPTKARTPSTVVTPPTPNLPPRTPSPVRTNPRGHSSSGSLPSNTLARLPASEQITHRRVRSATAASVRSTTGTLTPTVEEVKTPGGSVVHPSNSSGFFASFYSATQNAVSSIGASLTGSNFQKNRPGTAQSDSQKTGPTGGEEVLLNDGQKEKAAPPPEPAIKTLGAGNLSLSHLGISESSLKSDPMATKVETTEELTRSPAAQVDGGKEEQRDVEQAVNDAYSERLPDKTPVVADNVSVTGRGRSISSVFGSQSGFNTPPRSSTPPRSNTLDSTIPVPTRSGSTRSRLSGRRARTKRGSSGATGHTIAAALGASSAALLNPAAPATGSSPTGFAVANSKRNKDFHNLFKSVPEDDYLIEDYSAALQRDILLQGRIYISERHICFSSNILGWVTNLVMSFDEVVAMEKKSTAMIFPNAIVIQTLHAKNTFASFISRDTSYDLLLGIWKISHPNIKVSENGHKLDESGNAEKGDGTDTATDEASDDGSDFDDDEGDGRSSLNGATASFSGSDIGVEVPRSVSQKTVINGTANGSPNTSAIKPADGAAVAAGQEAAQDFPGPATHGPTECADQDTHYDKLLLDTTIPAPLGKIYSMVFGPESGVVMKRFLVDDQKSDDYQATDDKKGLGEDAKTRSYSYIKPLGGSIGPKSTKCLVTENLDAFDLEKAVSVTCSTQTPDVPSGNVFVTKTKYCLSWGPGNSTRLIMNCTVEWSGKSWLKGPIEKGANDGQVQYGKDLVAFLKAAVSSTKGGKGVKKTKGRKKRTRSDAASVTENESSSKTKAANNTNWGPLEPLHGILEPLLGPLGSPTGVLGILLLFVTILWIRASWKGSGPATTIDLRTMSAERIAAYEELWRREENQLWDWLDDRLAIDEMKIARTSPLKSDLKFQDPDLPGQLASQRMSDREIEEAVRLTGQRLDSLKSIIEKKKKVRGSQETVASEAVSSSSS